MDDLLTPDDEHLTPEELRKNLKVSKVFIYKMVQQGKIPFYRLGGGKCIRFSKSEIEKWLKDGRNKQWHRDLK